MDGREARDGIALMVLNGSLNVLISEVGGDFEVHAGLLLIELLKHAFNYAPYR